MRTRPQSGFSLVEVMCAILIMGVGIVGLTQGITTALQSSKEAELQASAALVAAGQIELLRADGWLLNGATEGNAAPALPEYLWRQTIRAADVDGLHDVAVVIEHRKTGVSIYELRTLLFDPPSFSTLDQKDERQDRSSRGSNNRRHQ